MQRPYTTRSPWQAMFALATVLVLLGAPAASGANENTTPQASRPNIILILTDDLDLSLVSPTITPRIDQLLTQQGASFRNFFVNVSLCCPSRASLLRGQYVHNHELYTNGGPTGGFARAYDTGLEQTTVATALKEAGYRTALFGKYLNGYPSANDETYIPPGWSEWASPTSDNAYGGFNYALNENGTVVEYGTLPRDYLTDVLTRKAVNLITSTATLSDTPLFLYLAPYVPHQPATPAPRHSRLFEGAQTPRTPSWNEADVSDKPSNVSSLEPLTEANIQQLDTLYRRRLQSMQAVDEMVAAIVEALDSTGQLANSYIVFTTDNGYHMGQHRLKAGKYLPYEEDTHVPLLIRGPGIAPGTAIPQISSMVDLAPTFAAWAGVPLPLVPDGRSLVPLLGSTTPPTTWRQAALVEQYPFAGQQPVAALAGDAEGYEPYDAFDAQIDPTAFYFGIRTADYTYVEYSASAAGAQRELYDLRADPYQLQNLAATADPALLSRLSSYLATIRACVGASCQAADAAAPPRFPRGVYVPLVAIGS